MAEVETAPAAVEYQQKETVYCGGMFSALLYMQSLY